jgi:peptide methionine sulfoxide reductase MsrA
MEGNNAILFSKKIVVKVLPEKPFYMAEEEHQDYCIKNPDLMEEELKLSGRKK